MICLNEVSFGYRAGEPVLKNLNLQIPRGLTLVVGPNGAGKSTFLKLVAGIERPDRGTVIVEGSDLWREEETARFSLAYVPEHPDLTPYATILDVLRLVCRLRRQPTGLALEVLDRAGLRGLGRRSIRELSMGQKRRAVLAAAWIGEPRILVLDEPLEAMDRTMREEVIGWSRDLVAGGATLLVATHDLEPFAALASRALAFSGGRCAGIKPLPADQVGRMELLELLSRGSDTPPNSEPSNPVNRTDASEGYDGS